MNIVTDIFQFELPAQLACPKPTELRGISRDDVRLLVTDGDIVRHDHFRNLSDYLGKGDVLVVNTSATQAAAFPVDLPEGRKGVAHFSTRVDDRTWMVEIREIIADNTVRWHKGHKGQVLRLPQEASIRLQSKFHEDRQMLNLWKAEFDSTIPVEKYMASYGRPVQYYNLTNVYPLDYYQTYFSFHPGSSEMPSASRGFTQELIDKLLDKGIVLAPILLHTGISSLEENEKPYPEYMEIDHVSASIVNTALRKGNRVVAVGTTAVRAIETATNGEGLVMPLKGLTNCYISADYQMKTISGLVTGFHEPRASHLHMLQSLAGLRHIAGAYHAAIDHGYFWHQFGDIHLVLV